jgi:hypothetical protein
MGGTFRPQKNGIRLSIRLPKSEETETIIEDAGLDILNYTRWGKYQIRLTKNDIQPQKEILRDLMKQAYDNTNF